MSSKWYPNIVDIIEDAIVVFDTSSLLNVYRYSLVSSKRILNYIMEYEDKIWLPSQVKKEFYNNKGNVKRINLYKNIDKELNKHVDAKRDELLVQLSEYEKKRFPKFTELKSQLESKFSEMNTIVKTYKEDIAEETGVYKDFIEEVDSFLDSLLNSDKVSEELSLIELLEILKEGELRYKYKLPPGYEDSKTKEGIEKFGDLIVWKQIIKKSIDLTEKNIIFVTSDTKPDWFNKNSQKEIINPRQELISEFDHYNADKEIIIIPFENFIEETSDSSDQSDIELLLELRMNNLVKRLSKESFEKIINEKLELMDINELVKKVIQKSNSMDRKYIQNLNEISHPSIENFTVNTNGMKIEKNEITYYVNVISECEFTTISRSSNVLSYGTIYTDITLNVELKRKLDENEVTFISAFKETPSLIATVNHVITEKEKYIWGGDDDYIDEEEDDIFEKDAYTICPKCSRGISLLNDAGTGFCTDCSD